MRGMIMKKTLLISTFLVSLFYHFQVNATELTDALIENKSLPEIQALIKKGVDVVIATPPCQGISTAGQQIEGDERNSLTIFYPKEKTSSFI
jgi:site-specific DNA-cytosine methylase